MRARRMRQSHMRDKGVCRMELEGHEDEFGRYYDMEALAEGSPLWEEVEVDDEEEEGGEGLEQPALGGSAAIEEDGSEPQGWMMVDGEADFDVLFERGVALGVLSEAELDQMTDRVASGAIRRAAGAPTPLVVAPRQGVSGRERTVAGGEGKGAGASCRAPITLVDALPLGLRSERSLVDAWRAPISEAHRKASAAAANEDDAASQVTVRRDVFEIEHPLRA